MKLNKNKVMSGLVIVLAVACATEGYLIYRHRSPSAEPINNGDIGALSSKLEKQFKSQRDHSFRMFDRFFGENFFSGTKDPFDEMLRLREQMNGLMDQSLKASFDDSWDSWFGNRFLGSGGTPDMNMTENDKDYTLTLTIPHLKDNNLKVSIDRDGISIHGDYSQMAEKKDEQGHVTSRQEIHRSLTRSFPIPPDADYEHARIDKQSDKMVITLPRNRMS